MELITGILYFIWVIISFVIKAIVYVTYFIPFIGYRILEFLHLWPHVWPLNPFV